MIDAWREAGGEGEIVFQALFSWAPDDEAAFESVRKWKGAQPPDHYTDDWHEPREMYEHGEQEMSDEEFAEQRDRRLGPRASTWSGSASSRSSARP